MKPELYKLPVKCYDSGMSIFKVKIEGMTLMSKSTLKTNIEILIDKCLGPDYAFIDFCSFRKNSIVVSKLPTLEALMK